MIGVEAVEVDRDYVATDREEILFRTRTNAALARLRTTVQCEQCKGVFLHLNTDPGSLSVPRFCAECQPTDNTENDNA